MKKTTSDIKAMARFPDLKTKIRLCGDESEGFYVESRRIDTFGHGNSFTQTHESKYEGMYLAFKEFMRIINMYNTIQKGIDDV